MTILNGIKNDYDMVRNSQETPSSIGILFNLIIGVFPIHSNTFSQMELNPVGCINKNALAMHSVKAKIII